MTNYRNIGLTLGKELDKSDMFELLQGISDGDEYTVLEWIKDSVKIRTAIETDYEIEWS